MKDNHEWSVQQNCWIAHRKNLASLMPRKPWNRAVDRRVVQCPPGRRDAMFEAFRHFGMLDDS